MEMMKSGYSSVSEFHYLHNQANGDKYDNISEISNVIIEASKYTGIGLNLLPVLYEQGGCDGRKLIGGQKRFLNTFDQYLKLVSNAGMSSEQFSTFLLTKEECLARI